MMLQLLLTIQQNNVIQHQTSQLMEQDFILGKTSYRYVVFYQETCCQDGVSFDYGDYIVIEGTVIEMEYIRLGIQ